MKKILILILICFTQNIFSQIAKQDKENEIPQNELTTFSEVIRDENYVYNSASISVNPQFPRGTEFLSAFIQQNFKNPKEGLTGKIYAAFIVEKDGSLSDIKIIRDIGFGTKEEAIRVLKLSPKWIPGKLKGKEVRVLYSIPIFIK